MATTVPPAEDIRARMDRMYRPQKCVYDLTRKHYLIGRDRLIAELGAKAGQRVLDVGCGTGRNLALIGQHYPGVHLYGLDAAAPMLDVARRKVPDAVLVRGVAEAVDPRSQLGVEGGFDHVTISYCLSMVDDPAAAIRAAVRALAPRGTLHVVDFGDMAGLPGWCRRAMTAWLARFRVRHRPEVEASLRAWAAEMCWRLERAELASGYALLLRLRGS
jgi:S-adenosylmethionine-diacylgycerolhomoserine-N-methlytransferase